MFKIPSNDGIKINGERLSSKSVKNFYIFLNSNLAFDWLKEKLNIVVIQKGVGTNYTFLNLSLHT